MNTIIVKFSKICLISLILMVILSQSVFAADKESDSTCFQQIDSLLSYDDYIDVTLDDGIEYSGKIRKISNDSLVIRYNSVLNYQSPVIHTIMTEQISKIKYSGVREEYKFLPKGIPEFFFSRQAFIIAMPIEINRHREMDRLTVNRLCLELVERYY